MLARGVAAVGDVALEGRLAHAAVPGRRRADTFADDRIHRRALGGAGRRGETWRSIGPSVAAPTAPGGGRRGVELLDADRRRLELGRAGLRIGRVDRQEVGRDVVLEVERHERQARPQALVDPDRRLDLAPARDDADALALGQAVASPRPRARCPATRRAAAARSSRRSGRRCCTSRAGARSSGGSGTRRRACRPAGRGRPARTAPGARAPGPPRAGCGGTARPGGSRRSTATGCRRAPRAAR